MYAWHEYQIFILGYADIKIKNENWIDDIDNDKAKTTDQPTRQDMIYEKTWFMTRYDLRQDLWQDKIFEYWKEIGHSKPLLY